jgi:hypothetical protein
MVAEPNGDSGALDVRVEKRGVRELREEQQRALELLVSGTSVAEAAQLVGIDRGTIFRWLKHDAAFVAAYNEWRETLRASCQARLMAMAERAAGAVEQALEKGDAKLGWAVLKEMKLMDGPMAVPSRSTDPKVVKRHMEISETFEGTADRLKVEGASGALKTLLEMAEGKVPKEE